MSYDSDYWYVRDAGNVAGPFTRAEVMERWGRGELEWYHEVSQDQLIWVSVSTLSNADVDVSEPGPAKSPTIRPKRHWRWVGTTVVCIGAVVALGWGFQGAMTGESPEAAAILRVLREDDRISKETMGSVSTSDTPSAYATAIGKYLIQVQGVDMSDCPPDFRFAFKRHLDCWVELRSALNAIPEDFLQGFFVGFMNGYLFRERDGGLSRMAANVQQASRNIKTSFREVEQIAAKYGAVL
jgi:hypothetical protein